MKSLASLLLATGFSLAASPAHSGTNPLDTMVGCWIGEDFAPVSLLMNASDGTSNQMLNQKMLLRFDYIQGTEYLVLGHIFEWDEKMTTVLGPTYQNGAYNPALGFLTFGFPTGGLDHVTQSEADKLLYVHTKSANLSAMSVRPLKRMDCKEADKLEAELVKKQQDQN